MADVTDSISCGIRVRVVKSSKSSKLVSNRRDLFIPMTGKRRGEKRKEKKRREERRRRTGVNFVKCDHTCHL